MEVVNNRKVLSSCNCGKRGGYRALLDRRRQDHGQKDLGGTARGNGERGGKILVTAGQGENVPRKKK